MHTHTSMCLAGLMCVLGVREMQQEVDSWRSLLLFEKVTWLSTSATLTKHLFEHFSDHAPLQPSYAWLDLATVLFCCFCTRRLWLMLRKCIKAGLWLGGLSCKATELTLPQKAGPYSKQTCCLHSADGTEPNNADSFNGTHQQTAVNWAWHLAKPMTLATCRDTLNNNDDIDDKVYQQRSCWC